MEGGAQGGAKGGRGLTLLNFNYLNNLNNLNSYPDSFLESGFENVRMVLLSLIILISYPETLKLRSILLLGPKVPGKEAPREGGQGQEMTRGEGPKGKGSTFRV